MDRLAKLLSNEQAMVIAVSYATGQETKGIVQSMAPAIERTDAKTDMIIANQLGESLANNCKIINMFTQLITYFIIQKPEMPRNRKLRKNRSKRL